MKLRLTRTIEYDPEEDDIRHALGIPESDEIEINGDIEVTITREIDVVLEDDTDWSVQVVDDE